MDQWSFIIRLVLVLPLLLVPVSSRANKHEKEHMYEYENEYEKEKENKYAHEKGSSKQVRISQGIGPHSRLDTYTLANYSRRTAMGNRLFAAAPVPVAVIWITVHARCNNS